MRTAQKKERTDTAGAARNIRSVATDWDAEIASGRTEIRGFDLKRRGSTELSQQV